MSLEHLVSRLAGLRRTGVGRYVAKCPAHKDRRASLSIRELDDGRVLVHCFASCSVDEVLAAAGVDMEALFPPRTPRGAGAPPERKPYSVRDLVAATSKELLVAWVFLGDVAAGAAISEADRKRAALARSRCMALIEELQLAS